MSSMSALSGWLPDISFQTSVREVYFTARTRRWSVLFISLSFGRHLHVAQAHHPDVVHDLDALEDDLPVDLVPVRGESHGHGVRRALGYLVSQVAEVVYHFFGLVVKTVDLRGIHDDPVEGVQVVVELLLDIRGGVHLLLDPHVAGGLQEHRLLLRLERALCLLRIQHDHRRQRGVDGLRTQGVCYQEQQKHCEESEGLSCHFFRLIDALSSMSWKPAASGTAPAGRSRRCHGRGCLRWRSTRHPGGYSI